MSQSPDTRKSVASPAKIMRRPIATDFRRMASESKDRMQAFKMHVDSTYLSDSQSTAREELKCESSDAADLPEKLPYKVKVHTNKDRTPDLE